MAASKSTTRTPRTTASRAASTARHYQPIPARRARSERALAQALEIPHDMYYKTYRGTRAELVAAGLALDGQFPGDPGCPSVSVYTFHREGRTVTVRRNPSNKYRIYLTFSEKEHSVERAAEDRAEEVKKVAKAVSEADEKIARLPRSAADYQRRVSKGVERILKGIVRPALAGGGTPEMVWFGEIFFGDTSGYKLDVDSVREFNDAIDELLDAVLNAAVRVDHAERQRKITEIRGEVVSQDAAFGHFLDNLVCGKSQ